MGVDWVFPNRITSSREENIYVDYARSDEGNVWISPWDSGLAIPGDPMILKIAKALDAAGFAQPDALSVVANLWRPVEMIDGLSWLQLREINLKTLNELESTGKLMADLADNNELILGNWLFPMSSLDLRVSTVDREELRRLQDDWAAAEEGL